MIPALNKGQFAFVPVNIFLQKITDAAKDVYPTPDPETIKPEIGQVVDGGSYTNDGPNPQDKELSYTAYVGQTVTNIDEVKTWIDANIPATKALSNEELKAVLKAAVEGLNTGFTAVVRTEKVTIAPYTTVTLKATTNYQTSVNNVSATVDGVVYNIPGVNIKVARIQLQHKILFQLLMIMVTVMAMETMLVVVMVTVQLTKIVLVSI